MQHWSKHISVFTFRPRHRFLRHNSSKTWSCLFIYWVLALRFVSLFHCLDGLPNYSVWQQSRSNLQEPPYFDPWHHPQWWQMSWWRQREKPNLQSAQRAYFSASLSLQLESLSFTFQWNSIVVSCRLVLPNYWKDIFFFCFYENKNLCTLKLLTRLHLRCLLTLLVVFAIDSSYLFYSRLYLLLLLTSAASFPQLDNMYIYFWFCLCTQELVDPTEIKIKCYNHNIWLQ